MDTYTLYYSIYSEYAGHGPTKTKGFKSKEKAFAYFNTCKEDWFAKVKEQWDAYPHLKNDDDWYENKNLDEDFDEVANFGGQVNWTIFSFSLMKD